MIASVQQPTRRRFSVREYYQMAEAGILTPADRVELIDGEVIQMPPIGPEHASSVLRASHVFFRAFGDRAMVLVQNPVRLDDYGEPQPDLALLQPAPDFYRSAHPSPPDIFVVVEVANATAAFDRRVKALAYAQHGIPEYLVVDLPQQAILVHRGPAPEGYRSMQTLRRGDRWAPLAFPDREIAVSDLLGEA